MEKLRSVSVPKRHFFSHGNPITHDMESPSLQQNRGISTKNLNYNNTSDTANRHAMRTEGNLALQEDLMDQYRSLPSQGTSPYANSRGNMGSRSRPSGSWGEFILKQGEAAQTIDRNFRVEDKLRAMKYREALDQMIQDGKNRKYEMRKESRQPTHDHQQVQEILRLERARELEDKRYYNAELQRIAKEKEELKRKEQLQREQEILEHRQMTAKMNEFEQFARIQGRLNKKQTFSDYQTQMNLKKQTLELEKQREQLETAEQNNFFAKQDEERRKLYDKIREKVYTEVPKYTMEREYEKYKELEDYVNRAIQEKTEKDALEMMRRNEALKKAQVDALYSNKAQAIERTVKNKVDKKYEQEEFGISLEQRKMVDHIEYLKREQELQQKKNYYETLKNQTQERQDAKYRENAMNNAEKILNFRRTKSPENFLEDNTLTSLPMNGRSYERSKQLRYIDNWLSNTAINHQKRK